MIAYNYDDDGDWTSAEPCTASLKWVPVAAMAEIAMTLPSIGLAWKEGKRACIAWHVGRTNNALARRQFRALHQHNPNPVRLMVTLRQPGPSLRGRRYERQS